MRKLSFLPLCRFTGKEILLLACQQFQSQTSPETTTHLKAETKRPGANTALFFYSGLGAGTRIYTIGLMKIYQPVITESETDPTPVNRQRQYQPEM